MAKVQQFSEKTNHLEKGDNRIKVRGRVYNEEKPETFNQVLFIFFELNFLTSRQPQLMPNSQHMHTLSLEIGFRNPILTIYMPEIMRIFLEFYKKICSQLWTVEEQLRLEALLVEFPPEPVENRRWKKIADALGMNTL